MIGIIIVGTLVGVLLIFLIVFYNKLIRHRNLIREGWSGIDVQLKKRYDLVPGLVKAVQGYADHERSLFEEITKMRTAGIEANTITDQTSAENALTKAIGKLMIVVEGYPDLKADSNFLELQKQLVEVEDDLSYARRYYNGTVRENNITVESFPSNLVAGMFGFKQAEFFEIDEAEKAVPTIDIQNSEE